jgi:hypothetical protein
LGDPAWRASFAVAARQDATERFASKVVAKKMESVYNSLIDRGHYEEKYEKK